MELNLPFPTAPPPPPQLEWFSKLINDTVNLHFSFTALNAIYGQGQISRVVSLKYRSW